MNAFEWYAWLLNWIVHHPIESIFILLAEFCVMYWLYYRFNQHKIFRYTFAPFFAPQNAVFNVFCMTLLGLDPPKEFATTSRMKRWKRRDGFDVPLITEPVWQFRIWFASTVCGIANRFDPEHC